MDSDYIANCDDTPIQNPIQILHIIWKIIRKYVKPEEKKPWQCNDIWHFVTDSGAPIKFPTMKPIE